MTQSVLRDFEYDLICSQSGVRLDSFVSEKTGLSRALVKKTVEDSARQIPPKELAEIQLD